MSGSTDSRRSLKSPKCGRSEKPCRDQFRLVTTTVIFSTIVFIVAPNTSCGIEAPEQRAVAFLNREVPKWSRDNHCFSCHNNGDGARALFHSAKTPFAPKADNLAQTVDFLSNPDRWKENGVDAPFSDKRLATLQFAAAVDAASRAGRLADRTTLIQAAGLVAKDQANDGSWKLDEAAPVGSPTTYGPPLATLIGLRTLRSADQKQFHNEIAKAEAWFRDSPIRNVQEAAAILLSLKNVGDQNRVKESLELLRRGQNQDGGWGPFLRSASEPFDTAVALLALSEVDVDKRESVRRGRNYLITIQKDDGSWTETTRPAGGESYAQRISTTAWVTMALLATQPDQFKAADPPKS